MKRIIYILSITITFFLVSTSSTNAQTSTIHITGKIKDKITGENLPQVKISITGNENAINDSTLSNSNGDWEFFIPVTSINENIDIPASFSVSQNYPNPFNPSTRVDISLPSEENVTVTIFNTLGETIDKYEEYLNSGNYTIEWNARGSAGVYFLNVMTKTGSVTRKMILLDGGFGTGLSGFRAGNSTSNNVNRLNKINTPISLKIRSTKYEYVTYLIDTVITGDEHFGFSMETVHSYCRLIDFHNDLPERMVDDTSYHIANYNTYNHTDIPRMKKGGLHAQFFAIWVNPNTHGNNPYNRAVDMINHFESELALNAESIGKARSPQEIVTLNNEGKIAAILAVEGGHTIENDILKLKALYDKGVRYMTITWNNSIGWAISAQDPLSTTVGLNDFGRDVIRTMDSLGIIIDVSHVGIKTIQDILSVSTNPIVATHSGARALRNHTRNLYDNQIVSIALSGGVIGIVFYPPFISSTGSVNVARVVDHIDHIVNLVGIHHVAVGSDFDGIGTNTVLGLEDVSKFPNLTKELLQRGYSLEEIELILRGNIMRVFEQVTANKKMKEKSSLVAGFSK